MKLVIVAPHFPPSSMPPSQRVRLMLSHLKSLDVESVVVTVKNKFRNDTEDPWLLELIGNDFELIETDAIPYSFASRFGVGDLALRSLPFLYSALKKRILKGDVDFVLYLVPPWYLLTIASLLKKKTKVPYAIDFIDPWVKSTEQKSLGFKKRVSQAIAKYFERKACLKANLIFSVSEGINQNLIERYPQIDKKNLISIPYGVEANDYQHVANQNSRGGVCKFSYVGAVWPDAYPVLNSLLEGFSKLKSDFHLEFIGTSYARGKGLKSQLDSFIDQHNLSGKVQEDPQRVPYKEAITIQAKADILILFGGMEPYYAASKLFGMIASTKPFFAYLHKDSFPAQILNELQHSYLVTYSHEKGKEPHTQTELVRKVLERLIREFNTFTPHKLDHPALIPHSARGMTEAFINPIKSYLEDEELHR